jgi:hypothetical protein
VPLPGCGFEFYVTAWDDVTAALRGAGSRGSGGGVKVQPALRSPRLAREGRLGYKEFTQLGETGARGRLVAIVSIRFTSFRADGYARSGCCPHSGLRALSWTATWRAAGPASRGPAPRLTESPPARSEGCLLVGSACSHTSVPRSHRWSTPSVSRVHPTRTAPHARLRVLDHSSPAAAAGRVSRGCGWCTPPRSRAW